MVLNQSLEECSTSFIGIAFARCGRTTRLSGSLNVRVRSSRISRRAVDIVQGGVARRAGPDSWRLFPSLGVMGLVALATLWEKRFVFPPERGSNSLAQVPRFLQQVIDMAQCFVEKRGLQRIHGDRALLPAIGTPKWISATNEALIGEFAPLLLRPAFERPSSFLRFDPFLCSDLKRGVCKTNSHRCALSLFSLGILQIGCGGSVRTL